MSQRSSAMAVPQVAAPHQLQYLEAMGITAWTARYRLPHAAETATCEWPDKPAAVAEEPPAQRLHSLLDDTPKATAPVSAPVTPAPAPAPVSGRMRSLLDATQAESTLSTPRSGTASAALSTSPTVADTATTPQEALRFALQVTALDDRWLVVLVQPHPPTPAEQRLLKAMLASVGIYADRTSAFIDFQWPMIEGLMVESPVIEAQQGIKAFLEGRACADLTPQRLVVFGAESDSSMSTFMRVLALDDAQQSTLLSLPVVQVPSLSTLMASPHEKAALWPTLHALGQQWHEHRTADMAEIDQ